MIDTHAHLNFEAFNTDLSQVIERSFSDGLEGIIVPGSNLNNSTLGAEIAGKHQGIFAAAGVHPSHVNELQANWQTIILNLASQQNVVAIGEVGLDFINRPDSNANAQNNLLHDFIDIANTAKLPIILHSRESEKEIIKIIMNHKPKYGCVLHCFCGDVGMANLAISAGMLLSFTAIITYPKNQHIRDIIALLPHDKIMIETDAPYLPPQSKRGQRCEPKDVVEVAKQIGQIWKKDVEYVDKVTSNNATAFFHI
jgi:TatD DNase family protein